VFVRGFDWGFDWEVRVGGQVKFTLGARAGTVRS